MGDDPFDGEAATSPTDKLIAKYSAAQATAENVQCATPVIEPSAKPNGCRTTR
jgi:hypothetical protein